MARLRNRVTGVVVTVDDDKAERLSTDFEPVEEKKSTAQRKSTSSSNSK